MKRIDFYHKANAEQIAEDISTSLQLPCPHDWCDGVDCDCDQCMVDWMTEELKDDDIDYLNEMIESREGK